MKKQIAKSNYPDIIEHGDAYQVHDGLNFIYGVQTLYRYPIRNEFHPIGDTLRPTYAAAPAVIQNGI